MKTFISIFLSFLLLTINGEKAAPHINEHSPISAGNIDAVLCGIIPPLCEGQCTDIPSDLSVKITGGTPPYRIKMTFNWNPALPQNTTTYTIRDIQESHVIRICHDNSLTTIGGEELQGDTTIFRIPTDHFPGDLEIREIEDADFCTTTIINGTNPTPLNATIGTYTDYQVDIPNHICDELILPDILPFRPNSRYFSEPNGAGLELFPGDLIDFNLINLPSGDLFDTLYVFDPTDQCNSQKLFPFVLNLSPLHDTPSDVSQCDAYVLPPYPGPISTAMAQYGSSRNFEPGTYLSPGDEIFFSQMIYLSDRITYPEGECIFLDSFFVDISAMPFAGIDTTLYICAGETTIISDPTLLLSNPDLGGQWGGTMIPDVDYNNPRDIDLSNMSPGLIYIMDYVIEKPGCPIATSQIVFEAIAPPYAGVSTQVSICTESGFQDFIALINEPELGGNWSQTSGTAIDLIDPTRVDFSTVPQDRYTFTYTIPPTADCPAQTAELTINVMTVLNAGADNAAIVCKGDSLDLELLVSTDADTFGTFKVDGLIDIPNGIWDSNMILLDEGEVNIQYILDSGNLNCPSDTAEFTVQLIQQPFAGIPLMVQFDECSGSVIDLPSLLEGENDGGLFYDTTDYSKPLDNSYPVGTFPASIAYIIAGSSTGSGSASGSSCIPDTSFFDINPLSAPTAALSYPNSGICEGECFETTVMMDRPYSVVLQINDMTAATGSFLYTLDLFDPTVITLCIDGNFGSSSNDTIFLGDNIRQLSLDVFEVNDPQFNCPSSSTIIPGPTLEIFENYEIDIQREVCEGEPALIEGVEYISSTRLNLTSENGCDSIVNINIDNFPNMLGEIDLTFCAGIPQEILGVTFTEDVDSLIVFENASVYGCDSTAKVLLEFADITTGSLDTIICEGDLIIIDGQSLTNEGSQEIPFAAGSVAGCDSSTLVSVSYFDIISGTLDTMLCAGSTINIDGSIIMDPGTIDVPYLPGSSTGCDSVTIVNVLETAVARGTLDTMICAGTTIVIDGVNLTDEGQSEIPTLATSAAGCDSVTVVNLSYRAVIEETYRDKLCLGDSLVIFGNTVQWGAVPSMLTIQDINGCDSLRLALEIEESQDILIYESIPFCEGENALLVFSGADTGFPTELYLNDQLVGVYATNAALPDTITCMAGTNILTARDLDCYVERTVTVQAIETTMPTIEVGQLSANNYLLNYSSPDNLTDIYWSTSTGIVCEACAELEIGVTEESTVLLSAISDEGCLVEVETVLAYTEIDTSLIVYETNAIILSDPENAVFYVQTNETIPILSMEIFDRWGNNVFSNQNFKSNDPREGWDGSYNGSPVEQGVYLYIFHYRDYDHVDSQMGGNLTVFR